MCLYVYKSVFSGNAVPEVIFMAKKGMARPERTQLHSKNTREPVQQLQGKAKSGKETAKPIVAGTDGADQKVWHTERPISKAYRELDTDPVRDNLENDLPFADLQDL